MSRHYSLKDLRDEISVELRNTPGTDARYTELEMSVAIRRAASVLSAYFWFTDEDRTKTYVQDVQTYAYDYPVQNIDSVAFQKDTTLSFAEDWFELQEGILQFIDEHAGGDTIVVYYGRNPFPYPNDLTLLTGLNTSVTAVALSSVTNNVNWPSNGWLKINNEVMHYTITAADRAANTLTVVRAQLDTAPDSHGAATVISFINRCDKLAYFEGVKDLAIAYLNRTRIVDAPSADIAGHVTVMREIMEGQRMWVRQHRMRQKGQVLNRFKTARSMQGRGRGNR